MLNRYLFSMALWAVRFSPRGGNCGEHGLLILEIGIFSVVVPWLVLFSMTWTGMLEMIACPAALVRFPATNVCTGAVVVVTWVGGAELVTVTMLTFGSVFTICDCSNNWNGQNKPLNSPLMGVKRAANQRAAAMA
jgi:hypothetical protein